MLRDKSLFFVYIFTLVRSPRVFLRSKNVSRGLVILALSLPSFCPALTIMLDPAGDAKHVGRKLEDSFERGVTLQCAEYVKRELEERFPDVRVVLTRFPGETLEFLQNPNFANRLVVDLYIHIACYQETAVKPSLYLYYVRNDEFATTPSGFCLCPYDKVHLFKQRTTKQYLALVEKVCKQSDISTKVDIKGPYGIPYKPLLGITSPAYAVEFGVKTKDDWKSYVPCMVESIAALMPLMLQEQNAHAHEVQP